VQRGMNSAFQACGMRGGLIFCALRNKLGGHALATAKLSEKMGCAFDIAGSEQAQFGLEGGDLKEALAFCKEHDHGCAGVTVHAGEVAGTRGNLAVALAEGSGVGRIGHGAAMAMGEGWEEMSEKGAESGVVVEVCLTAISTCASEASISHSRAQPVLTRSTCTRSRIIPAQLDLGRSAQTNTEIKTRRTRCRLSHRRLSSLPDVFVRGAFFPSH